MARTQSNAPAASASSASSDGYGLQICRMTEVRIKGRKFDMPETINGTMDAQARALIFTLPGVNWASTSAC